MSARLPMSAILWRVGSRPGMSRLQVENDGVTLAVDSHGPADGPLVVLLHGFLELGYSWRHQVGPLAAAGYHVLVPDLRGFVDSDAPEPIDAYAIDVAARDATTIIEHNGAERTAVTGQNSGAFLR